jgi:signal transduction histidine kinase
MSEDIGPMKEDLSEFGRRNVSDIRDINKHLIEKALEMRCQGYLAEAKARLLSETITEIDQSKKAVVSDRSRLEEQHKIISEQKEELRLLNQEKDKFFSIIAHDLRSPFVGFLGLTEILRQDISEVEIKKLSGKIHQSATQLFRLLENLLEWSALQMGRTQINPTATKLIEVVDSVVGVLSETITKKNIEVSVDVDGCQVYADPYMVEMAIRNLVNNSVKFTDNNGHISVGASEEAESVTISVSDTGVGMDEDKLSKLFRLSESVTTQGTAGEVGTGLGLILVQEMIERNYGRIWVESEVGQGTTFHIALPNAN